MLTTILFTYIPEPNKEQSWDKHLNYSGQIIKIEN